MERVMIFIDGSNLYHEARRYADGLRIDFDKLRDRLADGRDLIRTFYYAASPARPSDEQEAFFAKLSYLGIKTRIKQLRETVGVGGRREAREKGVDVALATDLVVNGVRHRFDWAILISGDQDYCQAIEQVQLEGLRVEVAFFRHAMADELKRTADRVLFMDEFIDSVRIVGRIAPRDEVRDRYQRHAPQPVTSANNNEYRRDERHREEAPSVAPPPATVPSSSDAEEQPPTESERVDRYNKR